MKKLLLLSAAIVMICGFSSGQTTLISSAGDGGFETGSSFLLNNWTVINGTQTNKWELGTAATGYSGNRAAYISTDAGVSYNYTNTSASVVHFYKDIVFPAGETDIQLTFDIQGMGEYSFDNLKIWLVATTTTPVAGTAVSGGTAIGLTYYSYLGSGFVRTGALLAAANAGTTKRIVFSWANDGSGGTMPPVALENIQLKSVTPAALGGIYTIDNTLPTSGSNFNNFTDAILKLNSDGISAGVTFNVTAGQVFKSLNPVITATGTSSNSIIFQKSGSGANPIIKMAGSYTSTFTNNAGIAINGGDYFTFDGLDIQLNDATNVNFLYGYYIYNASATNGSQYNTIKNSKITLNRTNTSSIGIYQTYITSPSSIAGANSYNRFHNITVENAYNGIYLLGLSAFPDINTEIGTTGSGQTTIGAATANDIGNGTLTTYGIRVAQQQNIKIFSCEVRNVTGTGSTNPVHGIFLDGLKGTANAIYQNNVHDIKCSSTLNGSTITGIRADAATGIIVNIYNNFVSAISSSSVTVASTQYVRGIAANVAATAGTVNIYYNSVWLDCSANISSAALYTQSGTMNATDNILANFSIAGATSKRYCFYVSGGTLTKSNNNDFYINTAGTGNNVGYYNFADRNTLALWQTVSAKDANSKNVDPVFVSATDLHASSGDLDAAGVTISTANGDALDISTDIDGATRNATTPDIGADEFTGALKSVGTIVCNQASTANVNINTSNNPILRIDIPVTGSAGTLNLNSLVITSLNTADADIAASGVKLFRTSTTTFGTANPLGTAQSFSSGTATFSTLGYDLPNGTTYVWVTYNITAVATLGNTADAKIAANAIDIAGITYPATEQSPAGNRTIADDRTLASVSVTQASVATAIKGALNNETLLLDFNVTGTTGTLPLNSVAVTYTGTSTADISASGLKLFRTTTNVFATTTPLGSAVSLSGGIATFSSLAYNLPSGHTYLWVAFDVASSATNNNKVDAKIAVNGIDVNGSTYNSVEDNPAGNRNIFYNTYALPFSEIFSGSIVSLPTDWSYSGTGFSQSSGAIYHGNNSTHGLYKNIYSSAPTCNAVTPLLGPVLAASQLDFDYRIVNFTGYPATATSLANLGTGTLKAEVSTDGITFSPVLTIDNTNHISSTGFATKTANLSAYAGQNVYIRFTATWGAGSGGDYYVDIDNVNVYSASNMSYSSGTATQSNTTSVNAGTASQQVIGIQVVTSGNLNPVNATKFTVNAAGTTNVTDISNTKLFYTGTSPAFAATGQFGATVSSPTSSNFDISGSQALASGTNYFWLAYDVNPTAVNGNVIDGECSIITIGGTDYIPSVTAPAGTRAIVNKTLTSVTGVQASTALVLKSDINKEVLRLDFTVAGPSTGSLILNSMNATYTGTNTADIAAGGVKLYATATTTFSTSNPVGSAQNLLGSVAAFSSLNYNLPTGTSYLWVTFDIAASATVNNSVDAKILANNINVAGTTYPTSDIDPAGSRSIKAALNGDYLIGASQSSPNYTTLTQAISELNSLGISGPVRFLLTDAGYPGETFPLTINTITGVSATNTFAIKPNVGITSALSGSASSAALIKILSNYVTIDGSNSPGGNTRDLTITNTGSTSPRVLLLGSTGTTPVSNVAIKNCVIINGNSNTSAVVVSDGASIGTAGYFNTISLQNNNIQKALAGIYCIAAVSAGNGSGLNISDNIMNASGTNAIRNIGIYVQGVDGATVSNNTIGNFEIGAAENDYGIWFATGTVNSSTSGNTISALGFSGTSAYAPVGIFISSNIISSNILVSGNTVSGLTSSGNATTSGINISGSTSGVTVAGNKISNIKNTNTGGYGSNGIQLGSSLTAANITVANNVIYDIAANGYSGVNVGDNGYGIVAETGGGYNIYYNSINLNTNQTSSTGNPACINITSGITTANSIDLRDNIFANTQTIGAQRYAIYSAAAATVFSNIDNNDYYTTGTNLGYLVSARTNLAAWKTATGKDISSISADPLFTSSSNLLPLPGSPAIGAGASVIGITTDIVGATRSITAPTIGAYEVVSGLLTWTGTTDNDWNKSTNWSPAGVPFTTTSVSIPNVVNDPVVYQAVSSPAQCNDMTIQSGAVVTINTGKALTVNGILTNSAGNSGLVVKSGGSLIESSTGVNATVESNIVGGEWHLISSPVSNAVSGMFLGKYLQTHAENGNAYTDILLGTIPLSAGKGFALYDATGFTSQYAGMLNTGVIGSANNVTRTEAGLNSGWNLVGNPYASSIDWNATSGWTKTNVNNATYVHVNSSTWASYVAGVGANGGTKYIAPGQGFFVNVASVGNGTLTMDNSVRVHNATAFFKNAVSNLVRLQVSGNDYTDEAVVRFTTEATPEFDGDFDAYKLFGDVAEAAQLYSLGSSPLAINAMTETSSVPVGMRAGAEGVYTIAATEINNLSDVSLEDTKTGIFTDLLKNSYTFSSSAAEAELRFVLHFGTLSVNETENTVAAIYASHGIVYVDLLNNVKGDIFIYNISGQLVASLPEAQGSSKISLVNTGNYIVKVISNKSTMVKKVFIKK